MAQIFISYRRGSTSPYAGRLRDRLVTDYGRDNVFMDVDAIPAGTDFEERINVAVQRADATLVVIGADWLTMRDAHGQRRLDDPDDFVRLEVEQALGTGRLVVPVLVEGSRIPAADALPEPLRELSRRNAVELRDAGWERDVENLAKSLRQTLMPGRKRRRAVVAGLAALLLVTATAAFVFFPRNDFDVNAEAVLGGYPVSAAASAGKVWVASQREGRIRTVDARTAKVAAGPRVGTDLSAVVAVGDRLWVGDFGRSATDQRGTVTLVDPTTGAVGTPAKTGDPFDLAADETSVWVLDLEGPLYRVAVADGAVKRFTSVPAPFDLALAEGVLWVIEVETGNLHGFDAVSGEVRGKPVYVAARPVNVAAAGKYVWVVTEQGMLIRVTAAGGAMKSEVLGGEGRRWIEADRSSVWIADEHDTVRQLDADTMETLAVSKVPAGAPEDIALDADQAWVLRSRSAGSSIVSVSSAETN